jgi:hypothetical protein
MVALLTALGVSLWQTRVAIAERDRATARFNDARQLANALIFKIHDEVRPLEALAADTATLVTRSDTAGTQYQAFRICEDGEEPLPDGCVLVQLLNADRQPATGTPAIVRFSNVVSHFSTWAVAIVTAASDTAPPAIDDNADIVLAATSAAGAIATFADPAAADDSGVVNVGCLPASGSLFPIGPTTVVCTATDPAGNTAQSEFTVTVVCCNISVTVNPATARRGDTVWISARVQNLSAITQPVVLESS